MPEVGLRELKARASEILRDVRERRRRYVVTSRGRPIAELVPVAEGADLSETGDPGQDGWDDFLQAADEVGRKWRGAPTVQEIFDQMRR